MVYGHQLKQDRNDDLAVIVVLNVKTEYRSEPYSCASQLLGTKSRPAFLSKQNLAAFYILETNMIAKHCATARALLFLILFYLSPFLRI